MLASTQTPNDTISKVLAEDRSKMLGPFWVRPTVRCIFTHTAQCARTLTHSAYWEEFECDLRDTARLLVLTATRKNNPGKISGRFKQCQRHSKQLSAGIKHGSSCYWLTELTECCFEPPSGGRREHTWMREQTLTLSIKSAPLWIFFFSFLVKLFFPSSPAMKQAFLSVQNSKNQTIPTGNVTFFPP